MRSTYPAHEFMRSTSVQNMRSRNPLHGLMRSRNPLHELMRSMNPGNQLRRITSVQNMLSRYPAPELMRCAGYHFSNKQDLYSVNARFYYYFFYRFLDFVNSTVLFTVLSFLLRGIDGIGSAGVITLPVSLCQTFPDRKALAIVSLEALNLSSINNSMLIPWLQILSSMH